MKIKEVFEKSLSTALSLSEHCIKLLEQKKTDFALEVIDHRSRVINIILQVSQSEAFSDLDPLTQAKFIAAIDDLQELDDKIQRLLDEEKLIIKGEISRTFKGKEGLKKYNLKNIK